MHTYKRAYIHTCFFAVYFIKQRAVEAAISRIYFRNGTFFQVVFVYLKAGVDVIQQQRPLHVTYSAHVCVCMYVYVRMNIRACVYKYARLCV